MGAGAFSKPSKAKRQDATSKGGRGARHARVELPSQPEANSRALSVNTRAGPAIMPPKARAMFTQQTRAAVYNYNNVPSYQPLSRHHHWNCALLCTESHSSLTSC